MSRRDFGLLRARVPAGYFAVKLGASESQLLHPGNLLPLSFTVRNPGSWILVLEQPFSVDLFSLIQCDNGAWYRIKIPITLQITHPYEFAAYAVERQILTTATLGYHLNEVVQNEVKERISKRPAEAQVREFTREIAGIAHIVLTESELSNIGLKLLVEESPESDRVSEEDVRVDWRQYYMPDEERGRLSWLAEGILGTQGFPAGEPLPPGTDLIEGVVRVLQMLVALGGLVSVVWPHWVLWSDLRIPSYAASFIAAALLFALFLAKQRLNMRNATGILSTFASSDEVASPILLKDRTRSTSYRLRVIFWDLVYRALISGRLDSVEAATSSLERLVRRLKADIQRAALSDIETLYGDLAVAPSDPIERRAFLLARILLSRRTLLDLDRLLISGKSFPKESEIARRLDYDITEGRDILQRAIERYRRLGIEPQGGILAPRQSRLRTLVMQVSRSHLAQRLRNRTSDIVHFTIWLLTWPLGIADTIWKTLTPIIWFSRNRASDLAASIVWTFARIIRHPVRSGAFTLVLLCGVLLFRTAETQEALRDLIRQVSTRPVSTICTKLLSLNCPFQSPNARRLCFWTDLSICPSLVAETATPRQKNGETDSTPASTDSPAKQGTDPTQPIPSVTPTWTLQPTLTWTPAPTPTRTPTPRRYPQCADGRAVITEPALYTVVTDRVTIRGTAIHQNFAYYKLELGVGTDPDSWSWMDLPDYSRQPVRNGVLGTWTVRNAQGTLNVQPGIYTIRLVVVDKTGNYPEPCRTVVVIKEP